LQAVLVALSQLYAPFLPFVTEYIYQQVRPSDSRESVHLGDYPNLTEWENADLLASMEIVRSIVSSGRELRAKSGIPLRQPLSQLQCLVLQNNVPDIDYNSVFLNKSERMLIAQELQVDRVEVVPALNPHFLQSESGNVALDTTLSEALHIKGQANTLRRAIQDLRKQANLQPGDKAKVWVSSISTQVAESLQTQLHNTELVTDAPDGAILAETTDSKESESLDIKLYSA
jgi:valyl-tRNA synthetase